jgi:hypothetical protein
MDEVEQDLLALEISLQIARTVDDLAKGRDVNLPELLSQLDPVTTRVMLGVLLGMMGSLIRIGRLDADDFTAAARDAD